MMTDGEARYTKAIESRYNNEDTFLYNGDTFLGPAVIADPYKVCSTGSSPLYFFCTRCLAILARHHNPHVSITVTAAAAVVVAATAARFPKNRGES